MLGVLQLGRWVHPQVWFFLKIGKKRNLGASLSGASCGTLSGISHFLWNSFRFWGVSSTSAWFWGAAYVPPMLGGLILGGGRGGARGPPVSWKTPGSGAK